MRIDHITLLVTSLDASMPYYDTLLPLIGFSRQRDHVWSDGDGVYLQFAEARAGTSRYERYGAGMNHVGFAARSADEVASVRAAMQAKQGVRVVFLSPLREGDSDPSGNFRRTSSMRLISSALLLCLLAVPAFAQSVQFKGGTVSIGDSVDRLHKAVGKPDRIRPFPGSAVTTLHEYLLGERQVFVSVRGGKVTGIADNHVVHKPGPQETGVRVDCPAFHRQVVRIQT